MTPNEIKRITEALILSQDAPMTLAQIKTALDIEINNDTLRLLLDEIKNDWSERAIHLVQVATGYRFQTAADVLPYIDRMRSEKPAQYSRAVLETLAIIAYRQPVTRGDIEDIRGVTVSAHIIKTLEERGWIDTVGHREVPGRPALLATTKQFLEDLGLLSLKELPALIGQEDMNTGQLELTAVQPDAHENPITDVESVPEPNADEATESVESKLEQMTEKLQNLVPAVDQVLHDEVAEESSAGEASSVHVSAIEETAPTADESNTAVDDADNESDNNHPNN